MRSIDYPLRTSDLNTKTNCFSLILLEDLFLIIIHRVGNIRRETKKEDKIFISVDFLSSLLTCSTNLHVLDLAWRVVLFVDWHRQIFFFFFCCRSASFAFRWIRSRRERRLFWLMSLIVQKETNNETKTSLFEHRSFPKRFGKSLLSIFSRTTGAHGFWNRSSHCPP